MLTFQLGGYRCFAWNCSYLLGERSECLRHVHTCSDLHALCVADVSCETPDVRDVMPCGRRGVWGECLAGGLRNTLDVRPCNALRLQSVAAMFCG